MRRWSIVVCLAAGAAARMEAQEPRGFEVGVQGLGMLANTAFVGGGFVGGLRPGGRLRVILAGYPGVQDGGFALRGELGAQFMLSPALRHGLGFYGLGGIAGQAGRRDAGYIVLGLGVETSPSGASGWVVEGGVGGGARIAVGWRRRWLKVPGR